jgi:DNA-binding transcriptional LysR family regulator
MNSSRKSFDWNHIRSFLVAHEEGSLSAAARSLGLTQPTLSRQITSLEEDLGIIVFERGHRSLTLTQSGLELLEYVKTMGEAANLISLAASGQSQKVEGQVSITASDAMSAYHIPGILKGLKEVAPDIEIEIVSSNEIRDLQRREADIAIRHVEPEQPDLIAKHVCNVQANLYASSSYLKKLGRPETTDDLTGAYFIGFENPERSLSIYQSMGLPIDRKNICYVTNDGVSRWEIVKQGLGVGLMDEKTAAITQGIEQVLPDLAPLEFPVWLTTHRELHSSRRIRVVFDFLFDALGGTRL